MHLLRVVYNAIVAFLWPPLPEECSNTQSWIDQLKEEVENTKSKCREEIRCWEKVVQQRTQSIKELEAKLDQLRATNAALRSGRFGKPEIRQRNMRDAFQYEQEIQRLNARIAGLESAMASRSDIADQFVSTYLTGTSANDSIRRAAFLFLGRDDTDPKTLRKQLLLHLHPDKRQASGNIACLMRAVLQFIAALKPN